MLKSVKLLRFVYLSSFLLLAVISAEVEYEQDIFGESSDSSDNEIEIIDSLPNNLGIDALVQNTFDHPVHLYYQDNPPILIDTIEELSDIRMNTFIGHTFFATKGSPDLEILAKFNIVRGKTIYELQPYNAELHTAAGGSVNVAKRTHLHPSVQYLDVGRSTSVNARFRSLSSRTIDLYYDGGPGEYVHSATLQMGQDTSSASYEGHQFFFTPHGDISTIIGRVTVSKDEVLYLLYDPAFPATAEVQGLTDAEMSYIAEYKNRTGLFWRSYYGPDGPRPPPQLYMWPADEVGQVHQVVSSHGQWQCNGTIADCQSSDPVVLELEVISLEPRAFIIKNFMSAYEADTIIELGRPGQTKSAIGSEDAGGVSVDSSRTSTNTWLSRGVSAETETLTLRAADLLQVDEALLNMDHNVEHMQVVHYDVGQQYISHHDWSVNNAPNMRYITLLFYLTDKASETAGGETAFPKAAGGRGIKVHPGKGSAVLFYNILPDGNPDDLALHESIPVEEGEKWLANYWVWDNVE